MKAKHETREQWLNAAIDLLRPVFQKRAGVRLPEKIRISCGWTSAGKRGKRIGECWGSKSSADGTFEMFISPILGSDDIQVLGVVTHEAVHAGVGLEQKHGPVFKRAATAMGLEGKMTATTESDAFKKEIAAPLLKTLGKYPHAVLRGGLSSGPGKQTTRLLKVFCPGCDYTLRITQKWIDIAVPACPVDICDRYETPMEVA